MKILYVVRTMNIGGIENFIRNIILHSYKSIETECLICDDAISDYEEEIRQYIKIYKLRAPKGMKARFVAELMRFFEINHKYDAIYVHMAYSNAIVGLCAKIKGIQKIYYHSHGMSLKKKCCIGERLYQFFMKNIMLRTGNLFFACSEQAGEYLFGKHFFQRNGIVLKNGIDVQAYIYDKQKRKNVRNKYNIDSECVVIGHVGSLCKNKNQELIIRAGWNLINAGYNVKVMLIGDGRNLNYLRNLATELGIFDKIIFTGKMHNISAYLSAMDVFMFPSISEGFGISLLEAQANGLPCVVSESIQSEVKVLRDKIIEVDLKDSIETWCNAVWRAKKIGRYVGAYKILEEKGFDIINTVSILKKLMGDDYVLENSL